MIQTPPDASHRMRTILQRIATGPELSKNISFDEARSAMGDILNGLVDPVQAGIFLIALRMKRETDEENRGVLQALMDHTRRTAVDVDELVDIADPFDGFSRCLPASPFLPPVLAACGVPAVCNGAETLGPKYGITSYQILKAAGVPVEQDIGRVARCLAQDDIGWAYLDQRIACPKLHELRSLRHLIVKRPCLTTIEVLLRPLSGRHTHLLTGYVHKAYPPVYARLAHHAGYTSASIVKGVEGGVTPSLQQPSKWFEVTDTLQREHRLEPQWVGIVDAPHRAVPPPSAPDREPGPVAAWAPAAAELGLQALSGEPGATRDSLVYAAAIVLIRLNRATDLASAAARVRAVIDSGAAHARFDAFRRRAGSAVN